MSTVCNYASAPWSPQMWSCWNIIFNFSLDKCPCTGFCQVMLSFMERSIWNRFNLKKVKFDAKIRQTYAINRIIYCKHHMNQAEFDEIILNTHCVYVIFSCKHMLKSRFDAKKFKYSYTYVIIWCKQHIRQFDVFYAVVIR